MNYGVKLLVLKRKNLVLYGKKGCGKTYIAQVIGYFAYQKFIFPDGVYLVQLEKLKHNESLVHFMEQYLGPDFKKNPHIFFENKEMLLIFDKAE